jgi:putative acetyltransferase
VAPLVRPYRPDDRAAVALVFHRAVREGATVYSESDRAAWSPSPEPDWSEPDRFVDQWTCVAEEEGKVTGFMSMRPDGFLDMAFVMPEVMGKGTAALLYDWVLDRARADGLRQLTVDATVYSRSFLLRRGWYDRGTHVREENGVTYEVHDLALDLSP